MNSSSLAEELKRSSPSPRTAHKASGTPRNLVSVLHSPSLAEDKGNGRGAATNDISDSSASLLQEALAGESFAEYPTLSYIWEFETGATKLKEIDNSVDIVIVLSDIQRAEQNRLHTKLKEMRSLPITTPTRVTTSSTTVPGGGFLSPSKNLIFFVICLMGVGLHALNLLCSSTYLSKGFTQKTFYSAGDNIHSAVKGVDPWISEVNGFHMVGTTEFNQWYSKHKEQCLINHDGSARKMEAIRMKEIFAQSKELHNTS
ncbi:hypothetical protein J437_LFUL001769 [Ladona fulva]|uniref:Uncharacterized protein n=1 Tax=Ladona fulva TaxID=123851 RepID=A0A8K0JXE9_LADFU|nr:hypothetical protein J437_LFUL001769 [Ladona fulva]